MKKVFLTMGLFLACGTFTSFAQEFIPNCQNNNALEARIDAIEASGWVELSRDFIPVNYLVAPDSPYLIGTIQVVFGVDCAPNEPCPQIARLYSEDAYQMNPNVCVWRAN